MPSILLSPFWSPCGTDNSTQVNQQSTPAFKIRIINKLNQGFATGKTPGLCLNQPVPNDMADCLYMEHIWTEAQSKQFLLDGTLPLDYTTVPANTRFTTMWIFDVTPNPSDARSFIVKLHGSKPDFKTYPATCVFDLGLEDDAAMIPSALLEILPMEDDKAKILLKEGAGEYLQRNASQYMQPGRYRLA